MNNTTVRVRIAPSPTGTLHIGTARTALFNYLFSRQNNGKMVLRIEDTDIKRSSNDYINNIIKGLKWLGIEYDEGPDIGGEYGPYIQSERIDIYKKYLSILEKNNIVYPCFCSEEELELERKEAEKNNIVYKYRGKCKNLSSYERLNFINSNKPYTLRFHVPNNKKIVVNDIIRGEVEFDTSLIGDFVVMKSDGIPTYNFAVVIDDYLMKITHIIRGEDIFSNTPKQILIYQALEANLPIFAHVSMILAPDRSKLSKRHGATSIEEYKNLGYLSEAIFNYIALLGWSSGDQKEIFNKKELIKLFNLNKISKSPAIFNIDKLNWLNSYYIKTLNDNDFLNLLIPYFKQENIDISIFNENKVKVILSLLKERINILSEAPNELKTILNEPEYSNTIESLLKEQESQNILNATFNVLNSLTTWEINDIHQKLEELIKVNNFKTKTFLKVIRSAITGRESGPDLVKILYILDKEKTLKRLEINLKQGG